MPSVQEYLSEMRRDLVHGSGWYFEKISELLSGIREEELPALRRSLPSIRPGMASISNIYELLKTRDDWSTDEARDLGRKLSEFKALSFERLRRQARGTKIGRAVTISYSKAVELFLMEAGVESVTLIQSKPGNEWKVAQREYGKFAEVTPIPESAMIALMGNVDSVIIGFDGIFASGYLTNKVGTHPLCLAAREVGKKVVAVGESFKSSVKPPGNVFMINTRISGKKVVIPLFDFVPLNLVGLLVTDIGTFVSPKVRDVVALHEEFIKKMIPGKGATPMQGKQ